MPECERGTVIILNGTPRSGKSAIAAEIQSTFDGVWVNLGVDNYMRALPERLLPGIGLRPGGERPDLEESIVLLYKALYRSVAVHSRLGLNVVMDVGHHDAYSQPRGILPMCARELRGLPALLVGVRCPLEDIISRRKATWGGDYEEIPAPVLLWQTAVHDPGIYDLEVDTSKLTPAQSALAIAQRLRAPALWTALERLAGGSGNTTRSE